jgi:hypothetical protein
MHCMRERYRLGMTICGALYGIPWVSAGDSFPQVAAQTGLEPATFTLTG